MVEAGSSSMPAGGEPFDRSRVMDVPPMRTLKPIFPQPNLGQPFVSSPPFTPFQPFQSGFSPFFPFGSPQAYQTPAPSQTPRPSWTPGPSPTPRPSRTPGASPTPRPSRTARPSSRITPNPTPPSFVPPLRSYRAATTETPKSTPGEASVPSTGKRKKGRPKGSKNKPKKPKFSDTDPLEPRGFPAVSSRDGGIGLNEKNDGNREIVLSVLSRFDALRRRLSQVEDLKTASLKAAGFLMNSGIRTNMKKRIGVVPGVEVGDIFYFRIEMCLVGLHLQTMAGIDYMLLKSDSDEEPVAVAIVSSGNYDDAMDNADFIVYTGHGGNANRKDKQAFDQKLERGNLALERALRRGTVVRVIRGVKDPYNPMSRVYVYDGLYEPKETWVEKISGCLIYKFKLMRLPGQPAAFAHWKLVRLWKQGLASRTGLILPDLTSGVETMPVSLVNNVDGEKGPAHFTYTATLRYDESFNLQQPSYSCSCFGACQPANLNCSCIRKNGGEMPYGPNGVLVSHKPLIYECGPACPCYTTCKNKVSQAGLKVYLEVFRTADRGWGLRSLDPIRAGAFICEYAGQVVHKDKAGEDSEDDEYVFDTTRVYAPLKWNYEPALLGEDPSESCENGDVPPPLLISAKRIGNVSRFMNHSCSPNVLWQPIARERDGEVFIHIAFYAMRHIPPMMELTYDYGASCTSESGKGGSSCGKKKCLCSSEKCRGTFG